MRHSPLRGIVSIAVLSAAVMLGGCQSNPKPPPLDAVSEAAAPTPNESAEAAPTLPAEAKGTSAASAKAFVRHFFDTLNYAMNSGDTEYLRSLSFGDCESCDAIASNIERTYGAGGHIRSQGWVVQSVALVPRQPRQRPIIDLGVTMKAEEVVVEQGATPKQYEGGKQPMTVYLVNHEGDWLVARMDRVA